MAGTDTVTAAASVGMSSSDTLGTTAGIMPQPIMPQRITGPPTTAPLITGTTVAPTTVAESASLLADMAVTTTVDAVVTAAGMAAAPVATAATGKLLHLSELLG